MWCGSMPVPSTGANLLAGVTIFSGISAPWRPSNTSWLWRGSSTTDWRTSSHQCPWSTFPGSWQKMWGDSTNSCVLSLSKSPLIFFFFFSTSFFSNHLMLLCYEFYEWIKLKTQLNRMGDKKFHAVLVHFIVFLPLVCVLTFNKFSSGNKILKLEPGSVRPFTINNELAGSQPNMLGPCLEI